MKTKFEIMMSLDKTLGEIGDFMKAYKLGGGYQYDESILTKKNNRIYLACHFIDDRMSIRDILDRIEQIISEVEWIKFNKIFIEYD
jgi:hypothetical protein